MKMKIKIKMKINKIIFKKIKTSLDYQKIFEQSLNIVKIFQLFELTQLFFEDDFDLYSDRSTAFISTTTTEHLKRPKN